MMTTNGIPMYTEALNVLQLNSNQIKLNQLFSTIEVLSHPETWYKKKFTNSCQ